MYTSLEQIFESVKNSEDPSVLAVVNAENEVVLQAVKMAKDDHAIRPMLFGRREGLVKMLETMGEDPDEYGIVHCENEDESVAGAIKAAREGRAHILLKGDVHTSKLMRGILNKETGIRESKCLTYMAVTEIPGYHKLLAVSDGAILIRPTFEQKVDIIHSVTKRLRAMGFEKIKVAVLAASDEVSEKQQETLDARQLVEMYKNGEFPEDVIIDGPLAFDLAVDPKAVRNKGYVSEVAGDADMILVHDIVIANAVVKALRIFAGAQSAGLVLGAKVPVILTSRGASARSKYESIMVAAATARG